MTVQEWAKKLLRADTLQEGLAPIIFVGNIIGIIPLKFNITSGKTNMRISYRYSFLSTFLLCGYIFCVVKVALNGFSFNSTVSSTILLKVGDYFRMDFGFIIVNMVPISFIINKAYYERFIDLCFDIDTIFSILARKIIYTPYKRLFFLGLLFHFCFHSIYLTVQWVFFVFWEEQENTALKIAIYIPGIIAALSLYIFTAVIRMANLYLVDLNTELERSCNANLLFEARGSLIKMLPLHTQIQKSKKITLLWNIYDKICEACDSISDGFSVMVLTILAESTFSLVFNLFHALTLIIKSYQGEDFWNQITILIFTIHQISLNALVISTPIWTCNTCKRLAKRTAVLVNQMMIHESDEAIASKLNQMSTHMLHRAPVFTACGLFVVDNTLLFTIIGATTTYMIILIQFSLTPLKTMDMGSPTAMNVTDTH